MPLRLCPAHSVVAPFHIASLSEWDKTVYKPRGAYRVVAQPYAARREWLAMKLAEGNHKAQAQLTQSKYHG